MNMREEEELVDGDSMEPRVAAQEEQEAYLILRVDPLVDLEDRGGVPGVPDSSSLSFISAGTLGGEYKKWNIINNA